jgi:hypothetical protein
MPSELLPASAAAFAPRASSVNVVLGFKVEPWLTQTLKRISKIKRPLNSVPQHQRCLTETLSSPNAIWTLASLLLPKAPEAELRKDPNLLIEALCNYEITHLEAYIVHVDMVLRNEVAYKLTPETIESLIEHHKDIHCVDAKANTYDWSEKEQQCKKLHEDFVQAVNKFVFRTHVSALEGLEEGGAGELLGGRSDEVKSNIMGLFKPLLPPPSKIPPLLWPRPAGTALPSQPSPPATISAPFNPWWMLAFSPGLPSISADFDASIWPMMGMGQLPSFWPTFSQPYSSSGIIAPVLYRPLPDKLPLVWDTTSRTAGSPRII